MTGHRPFSDLRNELLGAPGAAELIAEQRRLLEEEIARYEGGDESPEIEVPTTDGLPREVEPPARGTTSG
jgi:hypothetical protein